jgi:hypothetical protein
MKLINRHPLILLLLLLLSCNSEYPYLGKGYKLDSKGDYNLQIIDSLNNVKIGPHILDYSFDSNFIIIAQRPWDSIPGIHELNVNNSMKAFKYSTFKQYWILNTKEASISIYDSVKNIYRYSNVYGPYTKSVYLRTKLLLNVSKDLKLKDE